MSNLSGKAASTPPSEPRSARPLTSRPAFTLKPPIMVADQRQLEHYAAIWAQLPALAVDTESNSMYVYQERTCLIQISTLVANSGTEDQVQDYLVDPLAVDDLSALAPIFAAPHIEKIFHAAEYDVMCLRRDYDFTFESIFDTMIAARVLAYKQIGLAALLEQYFGVQADKRFQRANWMLRPLSTEQIQYAQQDTHYLFGLRDMLHDELHEQNRLDEAHEMFRNVAATRAAFPHTLDPDGFWKFRETREMSPQQLAIFRELYILRDDIARRRNTPIFKTISDEAILSLTAYPPEYPEDIYDTHGIAPSVADRYVDDILTAVRRGATAHPPRRPQRPDRHDERESALFLQLQKWRRTLADARGVESDVILTKEVLWRLVEDAPRTIEGVVESAKLGTWKREQYAEAILQIILADAAATESNVAIDDSDDSSVEFGT